VTALNEKREVRGGTNRSGHSQFPAAANQNLKKREAGIDQLAANRQKNAKKGKVTGATSLEERSRSEHERKAGNETTGRSLTRERRCLGAARWEETIRNGELLVRIVKGRGKTFRRSDDVES